MIEASPQLQLDGIVNNLVQRKVITHFQYQEYQLLKPVGLKRLGIDEIALIKGQGKYCAVLVDLDSSKPLMILESRTKGEIAKVLLGWGSEILNEIEEVSIDLWKVYKSLVEEIIPKAQVLADRFYVTIQINKELDTERKKEEWNQKLKKKKTRK